MPSHGLTLLVPTRPRSPIVLTTIVLACAICVISGCGLDHAENKGTDNQYIRDQGETSPPITMKDSSLLPDKIGNSWTWDVVTVRRNLTDSGMKEELVSTSEEIATIKASRISDARVGQHEVIVQTSRGNKPVYEEVYLLTNEEIGVVKPPPSPLLNNVQLLSTPTPIPLVHLPVVAGKEEIWNGVLKTPTLSLSGTCYSRVTGPDDVKTFAGKWMAWRIDSILATTIEGKTVSFPSTRWFVPGIGLVRQRWFSGNLVTEKTLHSYKVN